MSTTEAIQKSLQTKPQSIPFVDLIESYAKQFERVLPDHMKAARLVQIMQTCIARNPNLSKCTQESLIGALFTAAQLGIEPIAGRSWLLPFQNAKKKPDGTWHTVTECQFILGYKGAVQLFYQHEKGIGLSWGIRHEKDYFNMMLGTSPILQHSHAEGDRGPILGYWVIATLGHGFNGIHYMTRQECLDHGKQHSKSFDKKSNTFRPNSPWITNEESMCLKTVLTQGAKIWPVSIELQRAIDSDETSRILKPGFEDVLDIPSETDWENVQKANEARIVSETKENAPQ